MLRNKLVRVALVLLAVIFGLIGLLKATARVLDLVSVGQRQPQGKNHQPDGVELMNAPYPGQLDQGAAWRLGFREGKVRRISSPRGI